MLPQVLSAPLTTADARHAGVPSDQYFRSLDTPVGGEAAARHRTAGLDRMTCPGQVITEATYLEVPLDLEGIAREIGSAEEEAAMDLADAVEQARRSQGARGVVDLLVAALTDRGVRDDGYIDQYLDTLKSACRQTRRYREMIPVLHRIAELNPARRFEVAAELAVVHAHLGERDKGVALLESAYNQQVRLAPTRRCPEFSAIGEIAATVLGHPGLARAVAALRRFAVHVWSFVSPVDLTSPAAKSAVSARPYAGTLAAPAHPTGTTQPTGTPNPLAVPDHVGAALPADATDHADRPRRRPRLVLVQGAAA